MPVFEEKYCLKHNRTYHGYRCPQCIEEAKKKQFEEVTEPLKRAEQKKEAREQLAVILATLEKATLVKETTDYKLSVCPYCHEGSLYYDKHKKEFYCLNRYVCALNSTLRLLTEQINAGNS